MHTVLMMKLTVVCVCEDEKIRSVKEKKNNNWPFWRGKAIKKHIYCSPHIILIYIYGVIDIC